MNHAAIQTLIAVGISGACAIVSVCLAARRVARNNAGYCADCGGPRGSDFHTQAYTYRFGRPPGYTDLIGETIYVCRPCHGMSKWKTAATVVAGLLGLWAFFNRKFLDVYLWLMQ